MLKLKKKKNELRGVIGKLTEVRVILNKYFSSHFGNFTAQEKEIIQSVHIYKITDLGKYNLAMNQLLDSKEYGLGYMDDSSKSLNKASNMNNIGDNNKYKESMVIGDDNSKKTNYK